MTEDGAHSSQIAELEKRGDDLCEIRHDALRQLVFVPVVDTASLRLKFSLAYDEALRFNDSEGFLLAILTDLDRLAG